MLETQDLIEPSSISTSTSSSSAEKRSVRFQLIELIEIAIVLGDNPSLSTGGPPMSLGWDPVRRSEFDLDHYEKYRPKRKETRRELIISGKKRTKFFLRCGYSLPEIEEAAAISLNYRKQMTITKLMDPPIVMKDKVKNRFASCHETEAPTQRQRISRRNSNEPLVMPRREPDYDHIYPSSLSRQQQNLSGDAMNPARLRMQRRLSNFEPNNGLVRKLSNEKLVAPTRTISPKKKRFERRNSPTAELEPPTSPIAAMGLLPADGEEAPLRLPSRQISPNSMGRMLRRHHSAPLVAFQGLRIPVRTTSPNPNAMSPNPLSPQKEAKLSKRFQKESLLDLETPLVSIGSKNHAPSFPARSTTPSPPPSPPPAERPGRSPSSASPLKPRRRLSPPVELQTEVTPNRRC